MSSRSRPRHASIIVNNFNYARYLSEAIDSALAQTWPDTEVIVVDDGSVDESRQIILDYGSRITTVLKPNGGQGSAFNAGFALAAGDVILFLDADDRYRPDTVASVMPRFANPGVVKVHWPVNVIDERGRSLPPFHSRTLSRGNRQESAMRRGPASHTSPPSTANAWSRAFLNRVMPVDEQAFWQHVDSWFFATSPFCGRIVALDEPLCDYRWHGANRMAQIDARERLRWWELRAERLQLWLSQQGIESSIADWRANNPYYQELTAKASKTDDL